MNAAIGQNITNGMRPRPPRPTTARAAASVIAMATLVVLAAACGSNPSSTGSGPASTAGRSPNTSSVNSQLLGFSHCMRTHGVPDFPDPNSSGLLPKGELKHLGVSNARYQSANQACEHLIPGSFGMTAAEAQEIASDELAFARCMRSHGVANWPAPVLIRGRLVFDPQAAGIDPNAPRIASKMRDCDSVFPASLGVPPGAGHNPP